MIDPTLPTNPSLSPQRSAQLQDAAERLEAAFLSEMLKGVGLKGREGEFGGGAGEDQFTSMLREQQARQMVDAGGIGLAEHLFSALAKREKLDV